MGVVAAIIKAIIDEIGKKFKGTNTATNASLEATFATSKGFGMLAKILPESVTVEISEYLLHAQKKVLTEEGAEALFKAVLKLVYNSEIKQGVELSIDDLLNL